jgi:PHD/YefM family antitoxin component YafN of YafNO toxin-antitoxin module
MVGGLIKKMAPGVFRVHCLAVMGEVQSKREIVVITKRGQPAAQLIPADKDLKTKTIDEIYNVLAGRGAITGDV